MKLYERIENNNFDEIDKNRAIELIENGNGHLIYNENYFKLQKANEDLNREFCDLQNLYFKLQDESEAKRKEYQETYKDVREELKELRKENEEIKIKNNAIKRESEAYAENMIRLDNELNLEKEKSKYEWIRQNCLSQELVNKLYISIQKVKDKIEYLDNQQKQWIEDRELKESDSEIIFARDILKELLESEE